MTITRPRKFSLRIYIEFLFIYIHGRRTENDSELIWFSKDYTLIMYFASKIEKCLGLLTRWSFDDLRGQRKNSQKIDSLIKLHRLESKGVIVVCRLLDGNGDT